MIAGGGGARPPKLAGFSTATPPIVGNQSVPSAAARPDGWAPPLTSTLASPSAGPNATAVTVRRRPSARSFSSRRLTREMPRFNPIQKYPAPSSRI